MDVVITQEKCTGCGACARDCLRGLLVVEEGRARVREGYCIRCGHCAAVCPAGAVRLAGGGEDTPADYRPAAFDVDPAVLRNAMKFRRSVRQFRPEPVGEEELAALLDAARYAPTGGNRQGNRFILLDRERPAVTELVLRTLADAAERMDQDPGLRELTPYRSLCLDMYRAWREKGEDRLFYGAPCVLLTVARWPRSVSGRVDGALAAANAELMAHALGLGACYVGFVGIAAGLNPEVGRKLGIRKREELIATLAVGHPAVRYFRTAGRLPADLTQL